MGAAGEAVDEVVRGPGAGDLHLALAHHGAGGREFVLVALDKFAVDQVGDIQHHPAAICEAAAYLFVERHEQAMHLETDGACTRLALPCPGRVLAQVGQILAANTFGGDLLLELLAAAVVNKDFEVHLGLAAELIDVAEELALVGADGLAQALVVVEDGSEAEGQHGGMLETVADDPGVIDAGFLVEGLGRVVFADDDGEVAGGIKEDLIAAYSEDGFHRNRLTMTSQFRECLFFTDAVGVPCHDDILRLRAPVGAAGWWSSLNLGTTALFARGLTIVRCIVV